MPLNVSVTINFSSTDISPTAAVSIFQKLIRNHFAKWSTRPRKGAGAKLTPTYAYCFENCRDGVAFEEVRDDLDHNIHAHVLFHIPPERRHDFESRMWEWLDSLCTKPSGATALHFKYNLFDVASRRYLLKGTSKKWASVYGASYTPQGMILGKRTGCSRNLGPTARKALDKQMGIKRKINLAA